MRIDISENIYKIWKGIIKLSKKILFDKFISYFKKRFLFDSIFC